MLAFLLKWWEPIAVVVLASVLWGLGDYHGHAVANQVCAAKFADAAAAAQKKKDKQAALISAAADQYETDKTSLTTTVTTAQKELTDEKAKTPAYNSCHVGPAFLRGYNSVAGITSPAAK